MSQENTRIYAIIHIASETLVAIGFLIGIIPLAFWASMYWVIPLVVVNVIISIVAQDKTLPYTVTNLVLAVISVIPVVGSVTALAGVIMSILSVVECASILNPNLAKSPFPSVESTTVTGGKVIENTPSKKVSTQKSAADKSKSKASQKISPSVQTTEVILENKPQLEKVDQPVEKKKKVISKKIPTLSAKPKKKVSTEKPKKSL